jgi:hypothetical protein
MIAQNRTKINWREDRKTWGRLGDLAIGEISDLVTGQW